MPEFGTAAVRSRLEAQRVHEDSALVRVGHDAARHRYAARLAGVRKVFVSTVTMRVTTGGLL